MAYFGIPERLAEHLHEVRRRGGAVLISGINNSVLELNEAAIGRKFQPSRWREQQHAMAAA
jgi:hypothetical protein